MVRLSKTIKLLTLAAMVLIGGSATAQIMKFGELPGAIHQSPYDSEILYGQDGEKHLVIYDSNLNAVKKVNNLEISLDYDMLNVFCLAKNLFTTSGKYEFVAKVITGDDSTLTYNLEYVGYDEQTGESIYDTVWFYVYDYSYGYGIYNEDGELLFDLGYFSERDDNEWLNPFVKFNKLFVSVDTYDYKKKSGKTPVKESYDESERYYTKVYNLTGNTNSSVTSIQQDVNSSKLYPNPARQSVTLEYNIQGQMQEMQIMDINGRVVANYLLDPSQKQVRINTSDYKKGVYIYRYGNASGKFVVK